MTNTLDELRSSLEKVVDMIDESLLLRTDDATTLSVLDKSTTPLDFSQSTSLLDKCDNVEEQYRDSKPTIRVIHHLSCSGGTLVSKCIASMPNVFLLSEVHPSTDFHLASSKPRFSPSDVAGLARYANVPMQKELSKKIFLENIKMTAQHIKSYGGKLVLREHTHSDYLLGTKESEQSAVIDALSDDFEVNSVLTIRNPLDAYAALLKNKWLHFEPDNFDEYCRRFITLVERYDKNIIFRFEDLISEPTKEMRKICSVLKISFSDSFEDIFDVFKVTGNSGRSSSTIDKRTSLASNELVKQCHASQYFKKICDSGWYEMPVIESNQAEGESSHI